MTLKPPITRFLEKTELQPNGCLMWTGGRSGNGYGRFYSGGQMVGAHRWLYEYLYGPVAEPAMDHLCRNRACVNPQHLEPVTHRENLLRGETITARHAAKTHCPQGHPYEGRNLILRRGTNARSCRDCFNARQRHRRAVV